MTQPTESMKIDTDSRAKEIDHGTIPVSMSNAILGLPNKPGNQFDDRSSISAIKWTYGQLVGQKQLITTLTINKTTDAIKPIFVFPFTWNQINKQFFNSLAKLFYFKSFKLNFCFQFRSNFQQVGMMAISYSNYPFSCVPYIFGQKANTPYTPTTIAVGDEMFYPKILTRYFTTELDSLQAIYQLPHTLIMMGEDQDVPVTIDWLSPFKAGFDNVDDTSASCQWYTNDYDMGNLRLHVPIKMNTAPGVSDTLTVRVYGWISDIEYSGYVPDDSL